MAQVTLDATQNLVLITPIGSYNASATAITVSTSDAAKLPSAPFNMTWWQISAYQLPSSDPNAEIIRVTAVNTGTGVLTVTRGAEGPNGASTKSGGGTYAMILGVTQKMINDIQTGLNNTTFPDLIITVPIGGNNVGITVNQNDTTNNPDAVDIINTGSGKSLRIVNGSTEVLTLLASGLFGVNISTPTSTLTIGGSLEKAYRAITASRTLDITDDIVECTSGTFPVTLPTAVGCSGREYEIKNSGSGTITLATTSSQTIDGQTSITLLQYQALTVRSNGANYIIV